MSPVRPKHLKQLAWAVQQAAAWYGFHVGDPDDPDAQWFKDEMHETREALRAVRKAANRPPLTDPELRVAWRRAGGSFHGPNVETGTMPEVKLLKFLRELAQRGEP